MKKNCLVLALLIVGTVAAFGQKAKIGEVRYSVLDPEHFIKVYGKSWVLMDGRNINGTDLWNQTKTNNIPDGRGVFVRGVNAQRDALSGDPGGERPAGAYQTDEIKSHTHPYQDAYFAEIVCGHGTLTGNKGDWDDDNARCTSEQTTAAAGGIETRPRNIALYCYIKVNKRKAANASGK